MADDPKDDEAVETTKDADDPYDGDSVGTLSASVGAVSGDDEMKVPEAATGGDTMTLPLTGSLT